MSETGSIIEDFEEEEFEEEEEFMEEEEEEEEEDEEEEESEDEMEQKRSEILSEYHADKMAIKDIKIEEKHKINKFEFAKIIGLRAEMIAHGAEILINDNELKGLINVRDIAEKEFILHKIPFIIQRKHNTNSSGFTFQKLFI